MQLIGPALELQAVNEMLAAIGEDPVEELDHLPPSGNTALSVLRGVSRDLQEGGHWFNTERDYVLTPNDDQEIIIPDAVISLDGVDGDYIERRPRLYDRERKTFTFDGPVACSVIFHLEWDFLPSVARRFITALAIEKFVDGFPGANAVTEARNRNLIRAKAAFDKAAIRNADYNLLDNQSIQQLIRRS